MSFTCTSVIPLLARGITSSPDPMLLNWYPAFLNPTRAWRMTIWSPSGNGTTVFTTQFGRENQVGYPRFRSFSKDFNLLRVCVCVCVCFFFFKLCLNISPSWIIVFIDLTTISSSDVFADKNHVALWLSLVNVPGLNKLLKSEICTSEDRKLRAAHLILNYEPLSRIF